MNDFRVGFGQDSHRFSSDENRRLFLGGLEIPNEKGLEGNSDADVIIHALCNALMQAVGNDSFSTYADSMCQKGITDSQEYLKVALGHIQEKGYVINNIGLSIEARQPKILPITNEIKENLANILGIEKSVIGINATTGEEMTSFGRGEGIQAFAIVSLKK